MMRPPTEAAYSCLAESAGGFLIQKLGPAFPVGEHCHSGLKPEGLCQFGYLKATYKPPTAIIAANRNPGISRHPNLIGFMSALRKPDDRYALTHVSCVTGDTKIKTSRCDFQIRPNSFGNRSVPNERGRQLGRPQV
jgi:hypothetical protein